MKSTGGSVFLGTTWSTSPITVTAVFCIVKLEPAPPLLIAFVTLALLDFSNQVFQLWNDIGLVCLTRMLGGTLKRLLCKLCRVWGLTEQKTLGSDLAVIRDTLAWVDEDGVPKPRKFEAVISKEIQRRKVGRKWLVGSYWLLMKHPYFLQNHRRNYS